MAKRGKSRGRTVGNTKTKVARRERKTVDPAPDKAKQAQTKGVSNNGPRRRTPAVTAKPKNGKSAKPAAATRERKKQSAAARKEKGEQRFPMDPNRPAEAMPDFAAPTPVTADSAVHSPKDVPAAAPSPFPPVPTPPAPMPANEFPAASAPSAGSPEDAAVTAAPASPGEAVPPPLPTDKPGEPAPLDSPRLDTDAAVDAASARASLAADPVAPVAKEDSRPTLADRMEKSHRVPMSMIDTPVQPPQEPVHAPSAPLLFEIAWEVCWQLGGIYTVLRSKAGAMTKRWGDRYCLIGPYNPATAALEFEERPTDGIIREVLDELRNTGMACHYGRWLIAGRPRVILLDHRARYWRLGEDKYMFWKDHGIAVPDGDGEVNDVVAFGFAVAEFFRVLSERKGSQPILAHFHEWMGGAAVPRIAHMRLPVTTVFTTHATLLGRYLAGDNPHFYDHLPFIDGDRMADKYRILPRHQIEKAAAHASVVFTTVSDVTNSEAAQLLGRSADVIVPNGLNLTRFHALHEFQNLHAQYKERIHQFVMGHFFPSYTFDLDKTLYFFTSGRYEYTNKGMDLFIEVMHRLNQRLRNAADAPTIVSFIVTRAAVRHFNVEALRSQAQFRELQNTCFEQERLMGKRLLMSALTGRLPALSDLITPDASVKLKRAMHAWRSVRQPLIVTHDLADDAGDPVLKHMRHRHMFNAADDPVKVVFHPEFLSATSPLISLDYDSFVRGCHLGIFPSYYEPWGYTPLEAIALGVPAVTTDLSGFGTYVQHHIEDHDDNGIFVLNRRQRSFEQAAEDLVNWLLEFCSLNRRQRIEMRNRVERLSDLFDWERLASHYHEAHDLALERTLGKRPGKFEIKMV